jgi:hypothetical protein
MVYTEFTLKEICNLHKITEMRGYIYARLVCFVNPQKSEKEEQEPFVYTIEDICVTISSWLKSESD